MAEPGVDLVSPKAVALLGEKRTALLARIAEGYPFAKACALAGVSYDTFRWWMLRGADPASRSARVCPETIRVEPYWTFARDVRAAEATGRRYAPPGPRHGQLPSPLSPEAQAVILAGLARGWTYHDAARLAGVRLSTLLSWLRLGGYPRRLQVARPLDEKSLTEPYVSFVRAVLAAEESFLGVS